MGEQDWPVSVEEAVDRLIVLIDKKDLEVLRSMARRKLVGVTHFGLGMYVRNKFGLWGGNQELLDDTGYVDVDDASVAIVEALWKRLQ
jgi:hypothetical protein